MPSRFRKSRLNTVSLSGSLEASEIQQMRKSNLWIQIITACFWLVILALPTGAAIWAVTNLLELPALPECWTASWSDDSSASRVYCAKMLADKQNAQDLGAAIRLVNAIPDDDPLREEGDRLIKQWTQDLLQLGENAFQEGRLEDAIEIAQQAPNSALANDRIQHWQSVWDKAQKSYQDTETAIEQKNWADAFTASQGLLNIGNHYWMAQHEDLMQQLQASKESQPQRKPANNASPKPVDDLLTRLTREQKVAADTHIAKARSLARTGNLAGLQAAVNEAGELLYGDPRYDEAQQAIAAWQRQIEKMEDQPILNQAVALANKGNEDSLRAAIDEANQIGWGRALYDEAQTKIEQWRTQAYQLEVQAHTEQLNQISPGDRAAPSTPPPINSFPPQYNSSEAPNGRLTGGLNTPQPSATPQFLFPNP